MSRTEGFNQPDLLNILRKQEGRAPAPHQGAGSSAIPQKPAPSPAPFLPHTLSPASGRSPASPRRISKRDVLIIAALVAVVGGLGLLLVFRHKDAVPVAPTARTATPPPAPSRQGTVTAPPAGPSVNRPPGLGALKIYTRAPAGGGRSFHTLALVTYPAARESDARATCDHLRSKGPEFSDLFLYRTTSSQNGAQQLTICLGHFNRNPIHEPKGSPIAKLEMKARQMPNAVGRREFETCHFMPLSVAEP